MRWLKSFADSVHRIALSLERVADKIAAPEPEPVALAAPPEPVAVRCPKCQSARPSLTLLELTTAFIHHDGSVSEVITGYRKACQDCPAVYSVWKDGTFIQDAQSLPPSSRPEASRVAPPPPRDEDDKAPPPPLRMPRERPRV